MSEQIQNEILKLLQGTKDFVISQAPDAIQQLIGAYTYDAYIGIVFSSTAIVLLIACFFWSFCFDSFDSMAEIARVVLSVLIVISFISLFINFSEYGQIKNYPKGYLLKKAINK